jgi:hypothetical protein
MEQFPTTFLPEIVVAGAVDVSGELYGSTNQDERGPDNKIPHLYAPGSRVRVVAARPERLDVDAQGFRDSSGTSDGEAKPGPCRPKSSLWAISPRTDTLHQPPP